MAGSRKIGGRTIRRRRSWGVLPVGACVGVWLGLAGTSSALLTTNPATRVQHTLAAGVNFTEGNSRGVVGSLRANLKGETNIYIYRANIRVNYGRTEQENAAGRERMVLSSQQVEFNGEVRRLFNGQDYLQLKSGFQHNRVADLDYRVEAGPSVGRYFVRTSKQEGSVDIGVTQLREQKNGEETENRPALRLGSRWERLLASGANLSLEGEVLPALVDLQDALFNGEVAVETPLSGNLKLRVQLTDNYDSRPAEGKVRHDATLATLLTVKF